MIEVNRKLCDFCGTCSGVCPVDAVYIQDKSLVIDGHKCVMCLACVKVCPVNALYRRVKPAEGDYGDIESEMRIV